MHFITILRIIVCFQRRHKGTFEGLGSSVCCSRGRKNEQYPGIPDCTGRNDKGSMVDTWWPNHEEVQVVTAVKRLRRKRVAVYPLHTFVLGVGRDRGAFVLQGDQRCSAASDAQASPTEPSCTAVLAPAAGAPSHASAAPDAAGSGTAPRPALTKYPGLH
jgi:hypothetical protein